MSFTQEKKYNECTCMWDLLDTSIDDLEQMGQKALLKKIKANWQTALLLIHPDNKRTASTMEAIKMINLAKNILTEIYKNIRNPEGFNQNILNQRHKCDVVRETLLLIALKVKSSNKTNGYVYDNNDNYYYQDYQYMTESEDEDEFEKAKNNNQTTNNSTTNNNNYNNDNKNQPTEMKGHEGKDTESESTIDPGSPERRMSDKKEVKKEKIKEEKEEEKKCETESYIESYSNRKGKLKFKTFWQNMEGTAVWEDMDTIIRSHEPVLRKFMYKLKEERPKKFTNFVRLNEQTKQLWENVRNK